MTKLEADVVPEQQSFTIKVKQERDGRREWRNAAAWTNDARDRHLIRGWIWEMAEQRISGTNERERTGGIKAWRDRAEEPVISNMFLSAASRSQLWEYFHNRLCCKQFSSERGQETFALRVVLFCIWLKKTGLVPQMFCCSLQQPNELCRSNFFVFSMQSPSGTRTILRFFFWDVLQRQEEARCRSSRLSPPSSSFSLRKVNAAGSRVDASPESVICRAVALIHPALMHSLPPTKVESDARPVNRAAGLNRLM